MAWDITVVLEDKPGTLADMGEALGKAGINVKGCCGLPFDGRGIIRLLVDDPDAAIEALRGAGIEAHSPRPVVLKKFRDTPGELGEVTRRLANAGINVDTLYLSTTGEIVMCVDDLEKAKELA